MNPTPPGWPRLSSGLFYRDPATMIDWLCDAFGFEVRLIVTGDNGRIEHSELTFGDSLIMVSHEVDGTGKFGVPYRSPLSAGGANTQHLMLFVDDVDAHCAHATARGATIADPPKLHDYGADYWADRSYGAVDPEGHLWWFTQRIRG
jgi:uncharacterized glyoxalase superfamily protein PhnB